MKILPLLLSLLILTPLLSFGQKDFSWENKIPVMTPIPDSLQIEDAVVISYSENRKIENEIYYIKTAITIRKKIKILSQKGITEHSFFRIKQSSDMVIDVLDARTIKANGVILDFESSEIKSLESKTQLAGRTKDLFFAIPGVEVGDEIEMVCKFHSNNFRNNDYIFFNQNIPVLKSTFAIDAPKALLVKSNVYSGLKLPTVHNHLYSNLISWSSNDNPKIESNTVLHQFPHLIYQLDYSNMIIDHNYFDNWYDLIIHFEKSTFKPKIRKRKKFDKIWAEISQGETDQTILLQRIHQFVNTQIVITPLLDYESSEGIEYFLQNKKADPTILLKMYYVLFSKAKIDAKIAVGKSRNLGPIDLKMPTTAQISNFLFVIEINQEITFLTPKEASTTYVLQELPDLLYGTDLYMTSTRKRKKLLKINIPYLAN